jgi:mersacidin/lichenicidin family type 2 lantibiotic
MKIDVVRAWKDPEYRKSLTAEQLASLPPNPAGAGELSDGELNKTAGGLAAEEPGHSIFWCPPPITKDPPLC